MRSGVTLVGEGVSTILFLNPSSGEREAIVNADTDLHDVSIANMIIECGLKTEPPSDPNSSRSYRGGYNRGGILFRTLKESQMKNINLRNLTVQNGTYNGVFINGASNVSIIRCDFNENGVSVPSGQKLLHNLLLTHCSDVTIKDSRFATSPYGSGIALDQSSGVSLGNCEIARNGYYGILVTESENVSIANNLIEANDRSGVMIEFLQRGSQNIAVSNNLIHFNAGYGVESYAVKNGKVVNNTYAGNGKNKEQQKLSAEKFIVME